MESDNRSSDYCPSCSMSALHNKLLHLLQKSEIKDVPGQATELSIIRNRDKIGNDMQGHSLCFNKGE